MKDEKFPERVVLLLSAGLAGLVRLRYLVSLSKLVNPQKLVSQQGFVSSQGFAILWIFVTLIVPVVGKLNQSAAAEVRNFLGAGSETLVQVETTQEEVHRRAFQGN